MLNKKLAWNPQVATLTMTAIATFPAVDIFLPSLPTIAKEFGISTDAAQLSISIYMLGAFFCALFFGLLSDIHGRRPLLLIGVAIFAGGSLLCALAPNFLLFQVGRFLQGCGAITVPTVGYSLIHDSYPAKESAKIMGTFGSILSLSPLIAPSVGGLIAKDLGWRWVFIVLLANSVFSFFWLVKHIKDPLSVDEKQPFSVKKIAGEYVSLFKNRTFLIFISIFGLLVAGEWAYLTIAPFYFQQILGLSIEGSGLFISIIGLSYFIGNFSIGPIAEKFGLEKSVFIGLAISLSGAAILLLGSFVLSFSLVVVALAMGFYLAGLALVWGPSVTLSLQATKRHRGAASGLRSVAIMGFAGLGAVAGSAFYSLSLLPLSLFLLCTVAAALLLLGLQFSRQNPPQK